MKRVLYIDFENVSQQGLRGIQNLTKNDLVRIFLGPKCSKMSLIDADMVFHCDATVELITNDQIGKNALDFIIMVHLGYDIAKKAGNAYYVVSNDKGYEPAINEMKSMTGCTIERLPDVDAVIARGGEVKTGLLAFLHRVAPMPVTDNTTQHEVLGKGQKKTTTTRRTVGNGAGNRSGEQGSRNSSGRTGNTRSGQGSRSAKPQTGRTQGGRPQGAASDNAAKNADAERKAAQRIGESEETPKKVNRRTGEGTAEETTKKTVRRTAEAEQARAQRAQADAQRKASQAAAKPAQDEEEVLRKAIETCHTKQEFHNYLAKNLDNKDHILALYNRGKKFLTVDEEAVRRENGDSEDNN
ncbi:MAG: hypothetical protein J5649_01560 [Lachnospiraceae bacterium]|nr:hypothetical protein [Lachnospiraceae bacterium]